MGLKGLDHSGGGGLIFTLATKEYDSSEDTSNEMCCLMRGSIL